MENSKKNKHITFLKRIGILLPVLVILITISNFFFDEELLLFISIEGEGRVLPEEKPQYLPQIKRIFVDRFDRGRLLARPVPDTGQGFREWKGAMTSTHPEIAVEMYGRPRMITAVFSDEPAPGTAFQYVTIQCAGPGAGTTDPPPGSWVFRADMEETFEAFPAEGNFFGGWQIFYEDDTGGLQKSAVTESFPLYALPQGKNLTAIAWFHHHGGVITLESEGSGRYEIADGTYPLAMGTEATLRTGASDGWYFIGIKDESDQLVFAPENGRWGDFSFRVEEDKKYRALFAPLEKQISLHLEAAAPASGEILYNDVPCGTSLEADYGTALSLEARPLNSESAFSHWSGESLETPLHDPILSVIVKEDLELTAHFVPAKSFLHLEVVVDGEAESLPADLLSPLPGRHGFSGTAQAHAILSAPFLPEREEAFSHWEGDLPEGVNPADRQLLLPMDRDRKLLACFTRHNLRTLTLEKLDGARGSLLPPPGRYALAPDSTLSLQALPEKGRSFGGWKVYNTTGLERAFITPALPLVMTEDIRATAVFGKTTCHFAVTSSHPDGKLTPPPGDYLPAPGSIVDLQAEAPENMAFHHWISSREGILSTEASYRTTLNQDDTIKAVFGRPLHSLDLSIEGGGRVESDHETLDRVEKGKVVELHARPDSDAVFLCWEGDLPDNALSSQPRISLLMNQDIQVQARFIAADVQLHVQVEAPDDMAAPTLLPEAGSHGFLKGTQIPLLALPPVDSDIVFTGWTGDLESIDPGHTLTLEEDKTVTACFARKEDTDSVQLTILAPETKSSCHLRHLEPGSYLFSRDALLSLTVVLADNAFFAGWTGQIDKDIVYRDKALLLDEDKTVGMRSAQAGSVLTLLLDSVEVGRIDPPPGTYRLAEGMQVVLKASPLDGHYNFAGWHTHGGLVLSRRGRYQFTIEPGVGRHEIVGIFRKQVFPEPLTLCLNLPPSALP